MVGRADAARTHGDTSEGLGPINVRTGGCKLDDMSTSKLGQARFPRPNDDATDVHHLTDYNAFNFDDWQSGFTIKP